MSHDANLHFQTEHRALRAPPPGPPSLTPPLRLTRPPYVARTVASAKSEDKAIRAAFERALDKLPPGAIR